MTTRNERIVQRALTVFENTMKADPVTGISAKIRSESFNQGYDAAIDVLRDAAEEAAETAEMKAGILLSVTILRALKLTPKT